LAQGLSSELDQHGGFSGMCCFQLRESEIHLAVCSPLFQGFAKPFVFLFLASEHSRIARQKGGDLLIGALQLCELSHADTVDGK
jgi:hypothetical protein